MYHTAGVAAALMIASCGAKSDSAPPPPIDPGGTAETEAAEPAPPAAKGCEPLEYSPRIDIAEASGADLIDAGLLVVADSGNRGAYVLVDPATGALRERGSLPLGDAGDDLEGISHRGDRVIALTSAGWVHEYRREDGGFQLVTKPYPIADKPWRCARTRTNCGPNWEGLCLGEISVGERRCAGLAASKRDGALVCVDVDERGRLSLVADASIRVSPRHMLAGCAISNGTIWAVTNVLGANAILEIDPAGTVNPRLSMAPGSTEAVAARGDVVYRFSDTADRPSIAGRYRCP